MRNTLDLNVCPHGQFLDCDTCSALHRYCQRQVHDQCDDKTHGLRMLEESIIDTIHGCKIFHGREEDVNLDDCRFFISHPSRPEDAGKEIPFFKLLPAASKTAERLRKACA